MKDIEKQMLKIGLDLLKNQNKSIITNIENDIDNEKIRFLIEEGERLLGNENIDIDLNNVNISKIINEGVNDDRE